MFALWYLSLAVDEIRKRVKCPAQICSSSKNAQKIPTANTTTASDPPKVIPPQSKSEDKPAKPLNAPLKPVIPIQIPADTTSDLEKLKQLESPETVELIKTFEIPEAITEKPADIEQVTRPEPAASTPSQDMKHKTIVELEPPQEVAVDPTDVLLNPASNSTAPEKTRHPDGRLNKDIKEATTDFLAQEYSQPKRTSKRYMKSRQKNNHS